MSDAVWLLMTALALVAAGIGVLWTCLEDLWDAILAVLVFIALFAAAGDWLAQNAEHGLAVLQLTGEVARAVTVGLAGLTAVVGCLAASCASVVAWRRLAPSRRREPG